MKNGGSGGFRAWKASVLAEVEFVRHLNKLTTAGGAVKGGDFLLGVSVSERD